MPVAKKKKFKSGKIKRHKFKKKLGISPGFGKPWSAPSVPFRVEFSWENADGSEENEQVHWIVYANVFGDLGCRQILLFHELIIPQPPPQGIEKFLSPKNIPRVPDPHYFCLNKDPLLDLFECALNYPSLAIVIS